jgi:AAA15 family ATPase/GTPase
MIIDFSAANFRSFRDCATLSFVASTDKSNLDTHCIPSEGPDASWINRGAAIYGGNASGKSNLIFALATMHTMVLNSLAFTEAQFAEQYTPFLLDPVTAAQPTDFEVNLRLSGVRYKYGFSYDAHRIRSESLTVYKTGRGQNWFDREWNHETGIDDWTTFSTHFTGARETWRKATRPQALFLTTAVQLNSELLKPIYNWFNQNLVMINAQVLPGMINTTLQRINEPGFKDRVLKVLQAADIHVVDIQVEMKPGQQFNLIHEPGKPLSIRAADAEIPHVTFGHAMEDGSVRYFDRRFESAGTQMLLGIIAPVLDTLEKGKLLVIDDADASFHPLVTRFIVGLFHDPEVATSDCQFWITTHDVSLLDTDIMRRDQYWFVEKDEKQASVLIPLTDFSPRKNEALERGYLRGRYGGVPFISTMRH